MAGECIDSLFMELGIMTPCNCVCITWKILHRNHLRSITNMTQCILAINSLFVWIETEVRLKKTKITYVAVSNKNHVLSISSRHPSPFPPISHLCPSGPHFSHLPLPSSFRTRLFLFSSPGSCTGNCIHWEHSGRQREVFPLAPTLGTWKKKWGEEESNY